MKRLAVIALVFSAASIPVRGQNGVSDFHTFTGKSGNSVEARIVSISDDRSTLRLKRRDGTRFESKVTGLSLDDQQFVRGWLKSPNAKVVGKGRIRLFGTLPNGTSFDENAVSSQDDFVAIANQKGGWLGLRENGEVITSDGRSNGMTDVKRMGANAPWSLFTMKDGTVREGKGRLIFPENLVTVEQAVCGSGHHAARLRDGSVVVWGNAYGNPKAPVAPLEPLEDIVDIASTQGKMAAVNREGRVFCWDMKTTQINSKTLGDGVVEVNGSIFVFVALTKSGEVLEWSDPSLENIRRPEIDLRGGKAVAVRAGGATRAARREDGTWVAWGKDASGIVGKINSLGPHVSDLTFFSEPNASTAGWVAWIEP